MLLGSYNSYLGTERINQFEKSYLSSNIFTRLPRRELMFFGCINMFVVSQCSQISMMCFGKCGVVAFVLIAQVT